MLAKDANPFLRSGNAVMRVGQVFPAVSRNSRNVIRRLHQMLIRARDRTWTDFAAVALVMQVSHA